MAPNYLYLPGRVLESTSEVIVCTSAQWLHRTSSHMSRVCATNPYGQCLPCTVNSILGLSSCSVRGLDKQIENNQRDTLKEIDRKLTCRILYGYDLEFAFA